MPIASVTAGMGGLGWTVASGTQPQPFAVKVLGVLPDGIAPGVDMIIVKVGDVAGSTMIKDAGGIWHGMSGSPVYVNGQLIGAVSYGLASYGASPLGGLTPASTMLRLLGYAPRATRSAGMPQMQGRVTVPAAMRAELAREAGVSVAQASSFSVLSLPLAVSGLPASGRSTLQSRLDAAGMPLLVTPGTRAARPTASATYATPRPGGNLGALISYGDVTAGGIGTTTYVCKGVALGFGHPMDFSGPTGFGANESPVITVVRDPIAGPYKLTTIGAPFGTVDQDRMTGIRARLGVAPRTIPVTSTVTAIESGRSRTGRTDVTSVGYLPYLAASHAFLNLLTVFDQQSAGGALLAWTFHGKRANGTSWTFTRTNRFVSSRDIANDAVFEFYDELGDIAANPFQPVTFDGVSVTGTITNKVHVDTITDVRVSVNGGPFVSRTTLHVRPGAVVRVQPIVRTFSGTIARPVMKLVVPNAGGSPAALVVSGGYSDESGPITFPPSECSWDPLSCASSFNGLLAVLAGAQRNDEIRAGFLVLDRESGEPRPAGQKSTVVNAVVSGDFVIDVLQP